MLRKPGFIELTLVWVFSFGSGVMVICALIAMGFKMGFKKIFSCKQIKDRPSCLNDPSLGTHGYLHLQDVRIHYVASGPEDKPLMLFLHGFPEFWYSWRHQIREFQRDYRVVAIDLRGYGDSDKPSGIDSYVITKLQEDVKQVILALGYKKCILVSHDWGAILAWSFARFFPEMVEKLVVMNGPPYAIFKKIVRENSQQRKMSWYMAFFQLPWLPELNLSIADLAMFDRTFQVVEGLCSQEDILAYKYMFSQPGALTPPINYYRAAVQEGFLPCDMGYIMPILFVWGDGDLFLSREIPDLCAKANPDKITVKRIPEASHFVMQDKPKEVNAAIREWLQSQN